MAGVQGTVVPSSPGPPAGGTGSPSKEAVIAYGGPAGEGSSQRPGPTILEDGEARSGGGRCLWSSYGGQ